MKWFKILKYLACINASFLANVFFKKYFKGKDYKTARYIGLSASLVTLNLATWELAEAIKE